MNRCLSEETLHALVDGALAAAETEMATAHMAECGVCEARHRELQELEGRLRWEAVKVRLQSEEVDMNRLLHRVLERAHKDAAVEVYAAMGKEHLLRALAPVCGERLTERSIHLAAKDVFGAEAHVSKEVWDDFAHRLGDILYGVCGATVRSAVHHLSMQVLAGAA